MKWVYFFFANPSTTQVTPVFDGDKASPASAQSGFILKSPAVADGGQLPREYTGFGESATLPLEWSGAPAATRSYALILHHVDPEGKAKWYWTVYNIPSGTCSLPRNAKDVGILGNNSVNGRTEYAPPHSKGPGDKTYVYTVYALSAPLSLHVPAVEVSRSALLEAMKGRVLASAELKVVFARPAEADTAESKGSPEPIRNRS